MINEVILAGKVVYEPIFYETKEDKKGIITILIAEEEKGLTLFDKIECEGDAEQIKKFKQHDSVVIYGKLKKDNELKVIITKIKGV